jgi:hypothetical protein
VRALACLCILAAACGGGSDRPGNLHAAVTPAGVEAFWEPAEGSSWYQAQLVDFDNGPIGEPVEVHDTHVVIPGLAAGIQVDAFPGKRAIAPVTAGSTGGSASAWQLFGPADYVDGAVHADFPALQPGERLGVLLIHPSGDDGAQASVTVSGVVDAARPLPPATALLRSVEAPAAAPLHALHDAVRALQSTDLPSAAAAEAVTTSDHRGFCVAQGLDFSHHVRKPATRALQTAHGDFFIDDQDLAHYAPDFIAQLGAAYESNVWPADTQAFGAPTDVDGNGRIIALLTHELGAHLNGGWLIGYFGNADLTTARDDSGDCSGSGSNHGEIVYLNDIENGAANGWSASDLSGSIYPETLAHEIQHLLNLAHRCVEKHCDGPQETWLNEGLSKLAEDLAGYGWNSSIGRGEGARYLARTASDAALRGYDGRSLTLWEGDPIGNYQGVHSFLRFFADRAGTSVATQLAAGADLETALGRPWPRAMAEWASALLLSNESGAPFSYSGAGWSPLHQRLRPLDTRVPGTAALRKDGIAAFVTGVGQGAKATVTVRSDGAPWVVVVRTSAL